MEQVKASTEVDPWTEEPCRCGGASRSVDCAECASRRRELRVERALDLLSACPHPPRNIAFTELPASDVDHCVQRETCNRCGATRVTVNGEPHPYPELGEWEKPVLVQLLLAQREVTGRAPPMFCRACGCTDNEPCFVDAEEEPGAEPLKRRENVIFLPPRDGSDEECAWASPYLCTFCAAKGNR
jgi:hypothetical protein